MHYRCATELSLMFRLAVRVIFNTCLLYSETASYTFHPFSGETWPYSKAKIGYGEQEDKTLTVGRQWTATVSQTVWLRITHQPVGNRKRKFHQHFENGLPECVLYLFVCKSQITHILQKSRANGHGHAQGSWAVHISVIAVKPLHAETSYCLVVYCGHLSAAVFVNGYDFWWQNVHPL